MLTLVLSFVAFHEQLITDSLVYYFVDFNRDIISYPSFSYYSTFGRVWEILAGGCVAVLPVPKNGTRTFVLAAAGLVLVVFAFIGIPKDVLGKFSRISRFVFSDCAVFGTVLLLAYGKSGWVYKILTMRVWLLLGVVSFSLYLVHMPIIISWRSMVSLNGWGVATCLLLSVVMAAVVFYFGVERHKFSRVSAWLLWLAALGAGAYVMECNPQLPFWKDSKLVYRCHKYDWQYCTDSFLEGYDSEKLSKTNIVGSMSGKKTYRRHELLYLGDSSQKPRFVLLGDSHAASLFYGLDEFCHEESLCGLYSTTYVIPAHNHVVRKTVWYQAWFLEKEKALMAWLDKHPEIDTVILSERWEGRLGPIPTEAVKQFVRCLADRGIQVIVTLPIPEVPISTSLVRAYRLGETHGVGDMAAFTISYDQYLQKTKSARTLFEEMEAEGICRTLPIGDGLFRNGVFTAHDDGELLMSDFNHLSPEGSRRAIFGCRGQLLQLLNRERKSKVAE